MRKYLKKWNCILLLLIGCTCAQAQLKEAQNKEQQVEPGRRQPSITIYQTLCNIDLG